MPDSESTARIVIGTQLKKARNLLGFTLKEAADELHTRPERIADWEKGGTEPSLQELEALANLYGREIDYFLKETSNPPTKIRFRGKPGESLRNLSKDTKIVLGRFEELCRTAVEFEELIQKKRRVKLNILSPRLTAENAAQQTREQYDLVDKPIDNLRELLEESGVRIFEIPIPNDELSGFSFWHEEYGPCVLVHAKDVKGRRNFTLAHELAHLLYAHGSSICYIPSKFGEVHESIEHKANQFAVQLLLPKTGIVQDFKRRVLPRNPSEKELRPISIKWGVSIQALGYRLEDLGLINKGITNKIIESRPFYRRPKTPTWKRRLGKHFVGTSVEAYQKNLISIGKLAHAFQIPIRKAMELTERGER